MPISRTRQNLEADNGHILVAEASAWAEDKPTWTVLSLWWRNNDRPFLAVVETRYADDLREGSARSGAFGTVERALGWFLATPLREALIEKMPADHAARFPNNDELRRQRGLEKRAEKRGYQGPEDLRSLCEWLYPEVTGGPGDYAEMLRLDFGVQFETAMLWMDGRGEVQGWIKAFITSMRFFDRTAWHWSRGRGEKPESGMTVWQARALGTWHPGDEA